MVATTRRGGTADATAQERGQSRTENTDQATQDHLEDDMYTQPNQLNINGNSTFNFKHPSPERPRITDHAHYNSAFQIII